jgi:hypothetical protein
MTTLTLEQQQALDALFAPKAAIDPPVSATTRSPVADGFGSGRGETRQWPDEKARPARPDFLATWLGFSPDELRARLSSLLADKAALERQILDWAEANPLEAACELLAATSLAFYLVEKEANPKINSYVDAFYYIATCASVGYADMFAMTQPGRAIAALVMTVGPALAARIFDRPTE